MRRAYFIGTSPSVDEYRQTGSPDRGLTSPPRPTNPLSATGMQFGSCFLLSGMEPPELSPDMDHALKIMFDDEVWIECL